MMNPYYIEYLQYVVNTGGPTIAQFDEDFEPIGQKVRADLMPVFIKLGVGGKLELTEVAKAALANAGSARPAPKGGWEGK